MAGQNVVASLEPPHQSLHPLKDLTSMEIGIALASAF
jgi:hypothetical protein